MTDAINRLQRRLSIWIALVTLLSLVVVIGILARGGRADPPALRAASTLLDGSWQFRTGDDPRWSAASLEDKGWETIDLTAPPGSHDGDVGLPDFVKGWMAHGHSGYTGHAWYRRAVHVSAARVSWVILGPTLVEDGYELYWNGRLLGGSGRLTPPRVVGTRPLKFALPADAAGKTGVIAVRVFMLTRPGPGTEGGGMRTPPILAPQPAGDGLHRAQWERTIAGYVADAVEPLLIFAVAGLALWARSRSDFRGFLAFVSVALVLTAARRLNNALVAWTDVIDLPTYSFLAKYMWMPTLAAWALAWNRWRQPPSRIVDRAALTIMVVQIGATMAHQATIASVSRYTSLVLFVVIGARIAVAAPVRLLALTNLVLVVIASFGGELLDPLGVPGIWFPFGIGVSRTQYLYVALIPLMALLVVRASGAGSHARDTEGGGGGAVSRMRTRRSLMTPFCSTFSA